MQGTLSVLGVDQQSNTPPNSPVMIIPWRTPIWVHTKRGLSRGVGVGRAGGTGTWQVEYFNFLSVSYDEFLSNYYQIFNITVIYIRVTDTRFLD